ncbi:MAG: carboxymuconolactone decarboxylase family protein [Candidatus Dormibacteraceae bacterium]
MARVSLDPPRTLLYRIGAWCSRRQYGKVVDPGLAVANNPRVMQTYLGAEMTVRRWNRVPEGLKLLAVMAAAARIGCSWCMDFGYWDGVQKGLDRAKLRDLPAWRESAAFTPLERAVLAYAEAATATPPEVTDALVDALRPDLDDAQIVEIAMMVAMENLRSRFNSGLGLTSQGFKEQCDLPPIAVRA